MTNGFARLNDFVVALRYRKGLKTFTARPLKSATFSRYQRQTVCLGGRCQPQVEDRPGCARLPLLCGACSVNLGDA